MNGYETMSENYKILMQRGEIEKEAAEKAIRVYDFLAGCDTDDLFQLPAFSWTNFSLILRLSRQNITVGDLFFSFSLSFFFFWPVPVLQAPDPELLPG